MLANYNVTAVACSLEVCRFVSGANGTDDVQVQQQVVVNQQGTADLYLDEPD